MGTFLLVVGGIYLISAVLVVYWVVKAPEAYEDETGYHLGKPPPPPLPDYLQDNDQDAA